MLSAEAVQRPLFVATHLVQGLAVFRQVTIHAIGFSSAGSFAVPMLGTRAMRQLSGRRLPEHSADTSISPCRVTRLSSSPTQLVCLPPVVDAR